jgi:hypothetical protein
MRNKAVELLKTLAGVPKQTETIPILGLRIKRIARDRKVEERQLVIAALVAERPYRQSKSARRSVTGFVLA